MNDLTVTVTGWVATDPKLHVVPSGADLVSFRLASTSRFFDRGTNAWVDRDTEWFTVRVFRAAAQLILRSIRKGQPIVVVGRLHTNEWTAEKGQRTDLVIDAQTVGHDLTRGVAEFSRAVVKEEPADAHERANDEPIEEVEVEDVAADAEVVDPEVEDAKELEPAPF
jgi:single-strand DNA-binding protein